MDNSIKVMRILWSSLLFVALVFCAVSLLPASTYFGPMDLPFVAAPALCVVALADAAMSFVLPTMNLKRLAASMADKVTLESDPDSEKLFREAAPRIRVLRADKATLRGLLAAWQTQLILACALSESVAMIGALSSAFGFWPYWSAPLGILGFVLVAIRMPSERAVVQSVSKVLDAKLIVG